MHPLLLLLIGVAVVVAGILAFRLHAFLALLLAALVVGGLTPSDQIRRHGQARKMSEVEARKMADQSVGERIGRAFGNTCGTIGILIALASVVGVCLLESGAADKIVRFALRVFGESRAPLAFAIAGFTLGIPVFFDTVFYLMIPLGKAMAARTGKNYGLYVMTIAGGASIAHSLVPPTPGPLFTAAQLNVNLGTAILGGIILGSLVTVAGVTYSFWSNRRWPVPLREGPNVSLAELEELSRRDERTLPPLWLSLLPILLPVILISGDAVCPAQHVLKPVLSKLGNNNISMGIAAAIAITTLVVRKRREGKPTAKLVQSSLENAGEIILITAAGGAFGGMLQQTGIGEFIQQLIGGRSGLILPMAFLVTALLRTAQGSATVSMMTAVGMFSGLSDPATLGFHPVYLACVIGFGSKVMSWMNDSGFWVVCKMSGMTPGETLRNFSGQIGVMGILGLPITMLAAKLFPLV